MKSASVVGSGIVGLTCAIILQEAGYKVRILAKDRFENTLSQKVGAVWFPFQINPQEKANIWANLSYKRYQNDIKTGNGVSFIWFMNAYTSDRDKDWVEQIPKGKVREARVDELPKGMDKAKIAEVPLAEPPLYLPYLFETFLRSGGNFEQVEISNLNEMAALDTLVVNCTGLGAREICKDEDLHPMRGQILRCKKMEAPSFADPTKKGSLLYVINRGEDCVIGGTDYKDDWNNNPDPRDSQKILNRLHAAGISKKPEILEVVVGLRPVRSSVRFEFDPSYSNIFHNYGHGGAGFTVAWGCAMELVELLKGINEQVGGN